MEAKEKAEELVNKFIPHTRVFHEVLGWEDYKDSAKQCAIIAVDEIIDALCIIPYGIEYLQKRDYWQQVKHEIQNIQ